MTTTATASLLLYLLQNNFQEFLVQNKSLCFGFLSQTPAEKKQVIKNKYIEHQRAVEKEYNDKHRSAIALAALKKPNARELLQLESRLLHQELLERYGKRSLFDRLRLKIDEDTFTPDRWLTYFLYIHHVTDETRMQEERQKIEEADDFVLIKENVTQDGKTGRSVFEQFAEQVSLYHKECAHTILTQHKITSAYFTPLEREIKKMPQSDRDILLTHVFSNTIAELGHMQHGALKLALLQINSKSQEQESISCLFPQMILEEFAALETKLTAELPQTHHFTFSREVPSAEAIGIINDVAEAFLQEIAALHLTFSNFATMLKISIDCDYAEEEQQDLHASLSSTRLNSLFSSFRGLRSSSTSAPAAPQNDEQTRLNGYYNAFLKTVRILDVILKAGQKLTRKPKIAAGAPREVSFAV